MLAIETQLLLKTAHIVVFGVWFGTDLCTFYLSHRVLDREIPVATRQGIAKAMLGVEVIARVCLPTMLGLGLILYVQTFVFDANQGYNWVIAAVAAAWVSMVWAIHKGSVGELGTTLATVDLAFRTLVCGTLWVLGIWSVGVEDGPFAPHWIAVKVLLFATIMTCGIIIRFALRPFSAAFVDLVTNGSSDEREAAMGAALRRAQPLVGVIWMSLIVSTLLATGALTTTWLAR